MRSDADLVQAARRDEAGAFGELFDRWFDRVFAVARPIVRNDETAAEVAQDCFLTIWQQLDRLEDPDRFGGWALRMARNKALNRLQKEQRSRPLDTEIMTGLHDGGLHDPTASERLIETEAISEIRDRQELVWAATAALGERDASLADLLLRQQLTPAEIADEMGVEPNNAHQLLFRLRNKLGDAVANYLVWRNGRPLCDQLDALIGDRFDAAANRIVQRHAGRCEVCSEQRANVVDPQKLFASVPLLVAPLALKAKAAAALEALGVPVAGGAGGTGGPGPSGAIGTGLAAGTADVPANEPKRRWPGRLLRGAVAVAIIGLILLLFTGDIDDIRVAVTASTTTTTVPSTTVTSSTTSTSTSSTTSTTSSSTTIAPTVPVPPPTTADRPTPDTAPETVPSTTTTTSTVPAPPPAILRFIVRDAFNVTVVCQTGFGREAVWVTRNADSTSLSWSTGALDGLSASGRQIFCADGSETVTLTATGSGGMATATAQTPDDLI